MSKDPWGSTPPDLLTKLARHGIEDPKNLPPMPELIKLIGKSYAEELMEEIEGDHPEIL